MRRRLVVLLGVSLLAVACSSGRDGTGDDAGGGGGDGARRTQPADCDPARPGEAADSPQTFEVDGQTRVYLLALPDDYDGTSAIPLLLNFHGATNTKEGQEALTAMGEQGAARGYAVVTPDGSGEPQDWNYLGMSGRPDDLAFVEALVADLRDRLCIDEDRIYAAGHSAGSALTQFLACRETPRLAAVGLVGAFVPRPCPVTDPVPAVVAIHGSADPVVPYSGGTILGSSIGVPPVLETLEGYGEVYGCEQPVAQDEAVPGAVERRRYAGCDHGHEVVLYTVVGGGHEWPNDGRFSATETILDFFDRH